MKKRYLISSSILALFVGLVLVVLSMLPARPGVTKSNFGRIERGMKFGDVNAIFGKIHGLDELPLQPAMPGNQNVQFVLAWASDDGAMAIIAFENEVVIGTTWQDSTETVFAKVRRSIGLDNVAIAPPPVGAISAPPVMAVSPPVPVPEPVVQEEK